MPAGPAASRYKGSEGDAIEVSSSSLPSDVPGFLHEPHAKVTVGSNGIPQLSRKFVARRISEGETGRLKEELKCQACGKGYKHVSSLAKHLWEHTPEWNLTSKLLISKHQQVQLLEAASILVSMNEEDDEDATSASTPDIEVNDVESNDNDNDNDNESPQNNQSEGHDRIDRDHVSALDSHSAFSNLHSSSTTPGLYPDESSSPDSANEEPTGTTSRETSPIHHIKAVPIKCYPNVPSQLDSQSENLTPVRDIPITSARSISKSHHVPQVGSYQHRSRKLSVSLGTSPAPAIASSLLSMAQASPMPEPAHRRRDSSHYPPSYISGRTTGSPEIDDDGLQDPPLEQLDHGKDSGVFGDME